MATAAQLQPILEWVNNWFERELSAGAWEVSGGVMTPDPGLQPGQWFRVVGSVFNDGLHRWPADDLEDEAFTGEVWALAVPKAVEDMADEIAAWCEANASALSSPYTSESFGGYSYQRDGAGSGAGGADAWKAHFRSRLNAWRKL